MKQRFLLPVVAALGLAVASTAAPADPAPFKIDPVHSQVGFTVRHFFSKVSGRFNEFASAIQLDPKNLAASSVEATIQSASIFTDNPKRDGHLKSGDFFDAEKYPTLTFKSTKVTPGENGRMQIAGDLTIRDVTKPVVLDAALLGVGDVGVGGMPAMTRAGFEATTTINRKDYGIIWNKTLDQGGTMLGDDVTITLLVEAVKDEPQAQAQPAATKKK